MNYEQKYKNSFEAAKKIYANMKEGGNFSGMEDLEVIFPELAESESEDEKIRKGLIKLLRNLFNNYSYFIKDPFYTECIAWLEKQNDMTEIIKEKIIDHFDNHLMIDSRFSIGGLKNDILRIVNEVNQGEKKPVECSKEDEDILSDAEGWLDTLCDYLKDSSPKEVDVVKDTIRKLESFKDRVFIKPQQCVNEDAEKEKSDYVSGQFLYCKGSFNEFKEGESYWLEYIGNDTYIGRSDNILNQKFHITSRQLYTWLDPRHDPWTAVNHEENSPMSYGKELEEKIKKLIIRDWIAEDDVCFFDEAVMRIKKHNDYVLERLMVNHSKYISKDDLFTSIGKMIKLLTSLKKDGYESISEEWSGYEDNYFVADKYEYETDDEYASRLSQIINNEIDLIKDEQDEREKKLLEIKMLETKLNSLKKNI